MPSNGRESGGGFGPPRDSENAAIARLKRMGGDEFVAELAALFLEDMPARFATMHESMAGRDSDAIGAAAHAMKSASAQLGATRLARACEELEAAADRTDFAAAERCLPTIDAEYATFTAWLSSQARPARKPSPSGGPNDESSRPPGRPTIALVEDNADNRLLVDAILGDRFELHDYATGTDALVGMERRKPDLVLLDVSLPGMDGVEVVARLRRDPAWAAIPIVALTAHAMAGDRERYLAAGFDGYVAKPIVDERDLIDVVERLLEQRRSARRDAGAASRTTP